MVGWGGRGTQRKKIKRKKRRAVLGWLTHNVAKEAFSLDF